MKRRLTRAQYEALDEIFAQGYGYPEAAFGLSEVRGNGLAGAGMGRVLPSLIARGYLVRVPGIEVVVTCDDRTEPAYAISDAGRSAYNEYREAEGEGPWGCL